MCCGFNGTAKILCIREEIEIEYCEVNSCWFGHLASQSGTKEESKQKI